MTQQFLHVPDVRSARNEHRRHRVAQRVRCDAALDRRQLRVLLEDVLDRIDRQSRVRPADEQRPGGELTRRAQLEILLERLPHDRRSDRNVTRPLAATHDSQRDRLEIDIRDVERDELSDPDPGGEEQFQDQVVPDGAEITIARSATRISILPRLLDLGLRSQKQRPDLPRRENVGCLLLNRLPDLQPLGRRLFDEPLILHVTEEDLERRDFPPHRCVSIWAVVEFGYVTLQNVLRDLFRSRRFEMGMELKEIRFVRSECAIRKILLRLSVIEKPADRLFHLHSRYPHFRLSWVLRASRT